MQIKFNFNEKDIKTINIYVTPDSEDTNPDDGHFLEVFKTFTLQPVVTALGEDIVKMISSDSGNFVLEATSHENGELTLNAIYRNLYILVELAKNKIFSGSELDKPKAEEIINAAQDVPIDEIKSILNLTVD